MLHTGEKKNESSFKPLAENACYKLQNQCASDGHVRLKREKRALTFSKKACVLERKTS